MQILTEDITWARELLKQKKSIVQIASTDSEGRCLKWQGFLKENGKFSYFNIANGTDGLHYLKVQIYEEGLITIIQTYKFEG